MTDACDRLSLEAYRALLATVEAWHAKELHRLTLGEALRATRDDQ